MSDKRYVKEELAICLKDLTDLSAKIRDLTAQYHKKEAEYDDLIQEDMKQKTKFIPDMGPNTEIKE